MRKTLLFLTVLTLAQSFSAFHAVAQPSESQLSTAYQYAMRLYGMKRFGDAKEVFKKIAMVSTTPGLNAQALFFYAQSSFRTQDFDSCVKALDMLVQKWPNSSPVAKGLVFKFCYFMINQVCQITDRWDYYRYPEGKDEKGSTVWKESVPLGYKAKRINFRLGFGLLRVLNRVYSNAPQTAECRKKLIKMINTPLTVRWMDEKAPPDRWNHPTDFISTFSTLEKKYFSKFICERMFGGWESEKMYFFLDMYDDIRNLKPRFIALTKNLEDQDSGAQASSSPSGGASIVPAGDPQDPFYVFTLSKLFKISGYNPYTDSFANVTESGPADLDL